MTSSSRTAGHETAVERGCVRSGAHTRVRLPSGPWLLTSWWYMEVENLILEDDARGYFENMSDLDALIVVGVDDGDIFYGCAVNPDIDPEREFGALGWCAHLVTRIEDLGFDQAMVTDGWQYRSDGRWQLWGRPVDRPPLQVTRVSRRQRPSTKA